MTPELSAYAGLTTDENSPLNRKREGGGQLAMSSLCSLIASGIISMETVIPPVPRQ